MSSRARESQACVPAFPLLFGSDAGRAINLFPFQFCGTAHRTAAWLQTQRCKLALPANGQTWEGTKRAEDMWLLHLWALSAARRGVGFMCRTYVSLAVVFKLILSLETPSWTEAMSWRHVAFLSRASKGAKLLAVRQARIRRRLSSEQATSSGNPRARSGVQK